MRSIRSEADYDWAIAEVARYFENQPTPGTEAADHFDVLASLIEAYEAEYWPVEPADHLKGGNRNPHILSGGDLETGWLKP